MKKLNYVGAFLFCWGAIFFFASIGIMESSGVIGVHDIYDSESYKIYNGDLRFIIKSLSFAVYAVGSFIGSALCFGFSALFSKLETLESQYHKDKSEESAGNTMKMWDEED